MFYPAVLSVRSDELFDRFDTDYLRLFGSWIGGSVCCFLRRHSLRSELSPHGKRIDLRPDRLGSGDVGANTALACRPSLRLELFDAASLPRS